jgi:hypothetical protein
VVTACCCSFYFLSFHLGLAHEGLCTKDIKFPGSDVDSMHDVSSFSD